MRYPAYPLITIDPFVSVWSCSDVLSDDNTRLWHGMEKPIYGHITVDGERLRFLGAQEAGMPLPQRVIPQVSVEFKPLFTTYRFANSHVELTVKFWSPMILTDVQLMSTPCSYIDTFVRVLDGRKHDVKVELRVADCMCGSIDAPVQSENTCRGSYRLGMMTKRVLPEKAADVRLERGDGVDINWGRFYLAGENARYEAAYKAPAYNFTANYKEVFSDVTLGGFLVSDHELNGFDGECAFTDLFAYDDGWSLTVLGDTLKGIWTERFATISNAMDTFLAEHDALLAKTEEWQNRLLADAAPFGEDYANLITAVYRQVLAAHKAVRRNGELLYMSKECHSNGCINTMDVSYPSMPLMLCYNPELVRGLMAGIFEFAALPVWKYPFAPHDMGQYPVANGQVYGVLKSVRDEDPEFWRDEYKSDKDIFDFKYQMPVEESGNFILMAYAYLRADGSERAKAFVESKLPQLREWAEYLIEKGVDLENQLCTDDFAGHLGHNVNLAVKSCEALFAMGRLTGEEKYYDIARKYAAELVSLTDNGRGLSLIVGDPATWSLKYNMIWDTVAGFDLFPKAIREAEIRTYAEEGNAYGVPLDSRSTFTKSDWMIWASTLDDTDETTKAMSRQLCAFLDCTLDRIPMTDYFFTDTARRNWMWHRTVQGGLWMPVLKRMWNAEEDR